MLNLRRDISRLTRAFMGNGICTVQIGSWSGAYLGVLSVRNSVFLYVLLINMRCQYGETAADARSSRGGGKGLLQVLPILYPGQIVNRHST